MAGIFNSLARASNLAIASNAVLATAGLAWPIAAGQNVHGMYVIPFSVGATGGIRMQLITPAAVSFYNVSFDVQAVTTGAVNRFTQTASAVYTNALAVAGDYLITVWFSIINGVNAGSVDLQVAQNTSDALALTVKAGAFVDTCTV